MISTDQITSALNLARGSFFSMHQRLHPTRLAWCSNSAISPGHLLSDAAHTGRSLQFPYRFLPGPAGSKARPLTFRFDLRAQPRSVTAGCHMAPGPGPSTVTFSPKNPVQLVRSIFLPQVPSMPGQGPDNDLPVFLIWQLLLPEYTQATSVSLDPGQHAPNNYSTTQVVYFPVCPDTGCSRREHVRSSRKREKELVQFWPLVVSKFSGMAYFSSIYSITGVRHLAFWIEA